MGDAIEQMMLEKALEEFSAAELPVPSVSADQVSLEDVEGIDEVIVAGLLGDIVKAPGRAVKGFVKKVGGLGNLSAGVLTGPAGILGAVLHKAGAPDVVTTALNPAGSVIRKAVSGASAGLQARGNVLKKLGAGAQGGAAGVFQGGKDVVRNPLIKAVSTGVAFVFPPFAAVPVAMTAADKLITQVESVEPVKKALAVKTVRTTGQAAKAGDPAARRGLALLGIAKAVRGAVAARATPNARHAGYFVSSVGKVLKGAFVADTKGMPGIVAVGGGKTVVGNWRRA